MRATLNIRSFLFFPLASAGMLFPCRLKAQVPIDTVAARREMTVDLGLLHTTVFDRDLFGLLVAMRYAPQARWSAGIFLHTAQGTLVDGMGYDLGKPWLGFTEVGVDIGCPLLRSADWRCDAMLSTGAAIARLQDAAYRDHQWYGKGYQDVPKSIATEVFLAADPGLSVARRLFGRRHAPDGYLTALVSYRLVAGGASFGTTTGVPGFNAMLGVSASGFVP